MSQVPWVEASTLGPETARETWALAARQVLEETARSYHAFTTLPELADAVQQRSRIRTKGRAAQWMGDVLYRLAQDCVRRREPLLGALCVGADGRMGGWYADTVLHLRGEQVSDPDEHAAQERLECYRFHGAPLPPGGGVPARPPLPQRAERPRTAATGSPRPSARARQATPVAGRSGPDQSSRSRSRATADAPLRICERCFTALPASGVCDYCD